MIAVSDSWKDIQQRFILPESFIEIACTVAEVGIQQMAVATGTNEAIFATTENITGASTKLKAKKYATLERNLWVLDGSRQIVPKGAPYDNRGYASNDGSGSVTLTLPSVRTMALPGITVTWSSEYGEYPTKFAVTAKNGTSTVAYAEVTDNASVTSVVDLNISDYNSVTIDVLEWGHPDHRARVDQVMLGHVLTFTKNDILSYTHEQNGNLNSAELPKNSISFSVNNSDGRWNPSNPTGLERYLMERQLVTVRYGLDVNGTTEWIDAGEFYLSEWRTPSNGLEATFSARDSFEYLVSEPYTGVTTGTLTELTNAAFGVADLPESFVVELDESLSNYSGTLPEGDYTAAEIVQMCANAAGCVIYHDRSGVLHIEPMSKGYSGYTITTALSYSHPEVTLTKPLRKVSVSYGGTSTYTLEAGISGENQTVNNPLITTEEQANMVANWVSETLRTRKLVSGEFRADPRLDLFDVVIVESKYGAITPVAITNIRYSYGGSFRASYEGRVLVSDTDNTAKLGKMVLGKTVLGQG